MSDEITYLDLTLYDVDVDELIQRALTDAATKLPGWIPREGNTEVVLTEALSLVVAELVYAINRTVPLTLEGLLALYGVVRDEGSPASGFAEFTLADDFGHVIPEGTTVRATSSETGEDVDFVLTDDLTIDLGETTGTVPIEAAENGVAGNDFQAGAPLELVDAVPYVETVEVFTATTGGSDAETDTEFYDRGAALLSRLVTTLVLAEHFAAAALDNASVGRATAVDLYDGVGASVGSDEGHVTVVVTDENGAALDTDTKTAIQAELEAKAVAGLGVHVIDPTVTVVDVEVDIVVEPGAVAADVAGLVESALEDYLSPATWEWDDTVYLNNLIELVGAVEGVARADSFTDPLADVPLDGDAGRLAQAGTITVNVV